MANPLNLYATKIFGEHPLSIWALDEKVGYLSILDLSKQNLSNWLVEDAMVVDARDELLFSEVPPKEPFPDTFMNGLIESSSTGKIGLTLNDAINDNLFNTDLGSFSIGFYCFTYDRVVEATVGFSYIDSISLQEKSIIRTIRIPSTRSWAFVSETFSLPNNFSNIKPIIEFSYGLTNVPYELAINGISIGQWSEEFQTTDLGSTTSSLPENIPLLSKGIEAMPYGLQGSSGYYLASENNLYAKNSGLPLVFGSSSSTIISPNEITAEPSLIIPGEGFLNKVGQYRPMTFEYWTNIQSNAVVPKRIFGPIASDDGLYVEKHLLKLKIGNNLGSHHIGEWGRPMLIGIRLTFKTASLMINGEEVISLNFDEDSVDYPQPELNGDSLDWLGFYAYEDVPVIQIECPAIYSYEVPAIVQKRRFIYGQGVDFPPSISGLDNSTIMAIDYSVANYSKNVIYPNTSRWQDGFIDNLTANKNGLYLPDYRLPTLFLQSGKEKDWKIANFQLSEPGFSLKPGSLWETDNASLYFKNTSFLKEKLSGFYGLFKTSNNASDTQTFFKFENSSEKKYLHIYLENSTIFYSLDYIDANNNYVENIFYSAEINSTEDTFLVGLDITKASQFFGTNVSAFLGTLQSCKLYIGGSSTFTNTFDGNILKIGFCGKRNLDKTYSMFNDYGVPVDYSDENGGMLAYDDNKDTHVATYTLVPSKKLGVFSLDIATDSYWESYVPLSYFGSFEKDLNNKDFFTLDFVQFNVDYVKMNRFYNGTYDTSEMPVKTYVSFQYLKSGANANSQAFTTVPLDKTGIVNPGANWINSRYEVLNDSVIKMPIGANISNLAIVISIEIVSDGILQDNVLIRSLELASQTLGQLPNKINTRFGSDIIPFKKSGEYFDYKNVVPYTIYKKQSPYLYLTKNSGIRTRGNYSANHINGLSVPINKNKASFFKVNLFQMFLRYAEQEFPEFPLPVFEIVSEQSLIRFYLVADSNTKKRGQIYAIDAATQKLASGIVYYIDGKVVKRPILGLDIWSILSISFDEPVDFSSFTGAIRFTNPIIFNNISYYQTTQLDEIQRFAYRKWSAVRSGIDNPLDWGYWAGKEVVDDDVVIIPGAGSTWQEVLFLSETAPTLPDAENIYNQYVGTNSYIFDTQSSLLIKDYEASAYKDVLWSTSVNTPV